MKVSLFATCLVDMFQSYVGKANVITMKNKVHFGNRQIVLHPLYEGQNPLRVSPSCPSFAS
ncbi:hypothetical protein QE429_003839 [Bacillus sp. SORGH_AS 510]|nr:hypothetical protein [Bacillus sp. SORGH_AS_0510]